MSMCTSGIYLLNNRDIITDMLSKKFDENFDNVIVIISNVSSTSAFYRIYVKIRILVSEGCFGDFYEFLADYHFSVQMSVQNVTQRTE